MKPGKSLRETCGVVTSQEQQRSIAGSVVLRCSNMVQVGTYVPDLLASDVYVGTRREIPLSF
jgi:hypothetical protein